MVRRRHCRTGRIHRRGRIPRARPPADPAIRPAPPDQPEGLARHASRLGGLAEHSVIVPPQHRAVADDLDLFGHASLFQLVCAANTPIGMETLPRLASGNGIGRRDPAAAAGRGRARPAPGIAADARPRRPLARRPRPDTARFLEWAEDAPWLALRPRLCGCCGPCRPWSC